MKKKNIVIIGGGISGLELTKLLSHKIKHKVNITLIDKNSYHIWKPILHEISTGYLDANTNTINFNDHAYINKYNFKLGYLININKYKKYIIYKYKKNLNYKKKKLKYDILVISLGSISNDFNIPGVKQNCFFLDNIKQAMLLHKKIFNILLSNKKKKKIIIVGGGATGIELSAEIANLIKELKKYGYNINKKIINIIIIEAGKNILSLLPPKISYNVYNKLKKIGIIIINKTIVTYVYKYGLKTNKNIFINANLIIWAAGIKAPCFIKNINGLKINKINQLLIKPTLQTTLNESIFAIGDCASLKIGNNKFVPSRAQSAHQMANLCFKNILSILNNKPLSLYKYNDYGTIISLSKFYTIGYLIIKLINKNIIIKGKIAHFIYILLHKMHQIKIQGYIKTLLIIIINIINKFIKLKIKIK
ncbi:MAG: FAD-dependent oxidoreductase [Enterobacteriaceae bacterium PC38]|nr:MAG: FAD-dependent oxidoreductase [Enterobacteriaceae bacterium PC38]